MKYKRQLMTTMFAFALLAGGKTTFAAEDFVPNSKVPQYESQLQMKSYDKDNNDISKKNPAKKNKRLRNNFN